ncbi:MAG: YlxR family protein [Clostridia bacterium]|nr:YlxR family protein [Clostridia bacterium]
MQGTKKITLRMCVACRASLPKNEMLRIVKCADGEIRLDFSGKLAGRGAYICNSGECIRKLRKYRLLHKTFSANVCEEVYLRIEEEFLGRE